MLTPAGLVRAAADAGVEVLAVTDHDTSEGVAVAIKEATALGLRIIPGMEVSVDHKGRSVHVLAYFPAEALPLLEVWQGQRRQARRSRVVAMLDRLAELGLEVDRESVGRDADPKGSPGRPHVARALLAAGHVETLEEAFQLYLGRGKPAFVDTRGPTFEEAIDLIHGLPGLAVIAHPGIDRLGDSLEFFKDLGLDGVEVYHSSHSPEVTESLLASAHQLGLLVTGGSDYHGDPEADDEASQPGGKRLGNVPLPPDEWARFEAAYDALSTSL
jgi:3',5'-nucleoside bisphosphate phosphatase